MQGVVGSSPISSTDLIDPFPSDLEINRLHARRLRRRRGMVRHQAPCRSVRPRRLTPSDFRLQRRHRSPGSTRARGPRMLSRCREHPRHARTPGASSAAQRVLHLVLARAPRRDDSVRGDVPAPLCRSAGSSRRGAIPWLHTRRVARRSTDAVVHSVPSTVAQRRFADVRSAAATTTVRPGTEITASFLAGFVAAEGTFGVSRASRRFRFAVGLGATDSTHLLPLSRLLRLRAHLHVPAAEAALRRRVHLRGAEPARTTSR